MPNLNKKAGLTLIEITLVIAILGLLIGLAAALIGPLTIRMKVNETKETIDAVVEALISYTAASRCLPESLNQTGVGVRKDTDAWGRKLMYIYANEFRYCTAYYNDTCGRRETSLKVIYCKNANCTDREGPYNNIAFVVISRGHNNNFQIDNQTIETNVIRIYAPGVRVDNYSGTFIDGNDTIIENDEFDDIVKWVSLDELRIKAGCQGAQLKILTTELPIAIQGEFYNATILAEGGIPPYTWNWTNPQGTNPQGLEGITFNGNGNTLYLNVTPKCPGTYTFNATVKDSNGTNATRTFTLSVQPKLLTLNPISGTTWYATNGTPFNANISVSGGSGSFQNPPTCYPPNCLGLNLSCTPNQATILGNSTSPGTCYFNVAFKDTCNFTISGNYTVVIQSPSGGGGGGGTTTTTTTTPQFSCTLTAPYTVLKGQKATIRWTIYNGPANYGEFDPQSGGCKSFNPPPDNGQCVTAPLYITTTFTFKIRKGTQTASCSATIYVDDSPWPPSPSPLRY